MVENNNKSVSILTIAEDLGISKTTVGYVLSGQAKKRRVAQKTAQRVMDAASRLNYVPHLWAKNLARQSTKVVSMVIGGYEYNWAADVTRGLLPAFETEGYVPITSIHLWDAARQNQELMLALERRDEGIICQPLPDCAQSYVQVMDHRVPLVFIADTIESLPLVSYVAWDAVPAVETVVKHLIETGRKRVGFIGSELIMTKFVRERYQAYKNTIIKSGLEFDERWTKWCSSYQWVGWLSEKNNDVTPNSIGEVSIREVLEDLLNGHGYDLDAIFFPHDSLALAAYRELKQMGVKVPDDIALAGMGDVPLAADLAVGLTTVREPLEEIGKVAADVLAELIEDPSQAPIQRLVSGTDLKIRRTTGS